MLPKVATQILHHTSRAAVVAQNQTSHTIRNVLQLQSSSNASTSSAALPNRNAPGSSSQWGDSGTRTGGSRFSAGSRFQQNFVSASRAVAQSVTFAHDGSLLETDDVDDNRPTTVPLQLYRPRRRSHSLSITTPVKQRPEDKLAIFEAIQKHARFRHAFAHRQFHDQRFLLTSATTEIPPPHIFNAPSPIQSLLPQQNVDQSQTIPDDPPKKSLSVSHLPSNESSGIASEPRGNRSSKFHALEAARDSGDYLKAIDEVRRMREAGHTPSSLDYNMAIQALCATRRPGDSLAPVLETYNDMLKASLHPSVHTRLVLIQALTDRDFENHTTLLQLQKRRERRILSRPRASHVEDQQIAQLGLEDSFTLAVALFDKIVELKSNGKISTMVYANLLRSCSNHGDVDTAIRIFAQMERSNVRPSANIFAHLIVVHGKSGDIRGAEEVFHAFKSACKSGHIIWTRASDSRRDEFEGQRGGQLMVWNHMIEAYFRCGQLAGGLGLLEQMMDTTTIESSGLPDVPPPASSTFTAIIVGFCRLGDVQTALLWFDRLLQQRRMAPHPYAASVEPARPNQGAWITILEALALKGMTTELNRLFLRLLENASRDGLEVRAAERVIVFEANVKSIQADSDSRSANDKLDFILHHTILNEVPTDSFSIHQAILQQMMQALVTQYFRHGSRDKAFDAVERFIDTKLKGLQTDKADSHVGLDTPKDVVEAVLNHILSTERGLSLNDTLRILRLSHRAGIPPSRAVAMHLSRGYSLARSDTLIDELTPCEWEVLVYGATLLELPMDEAPASEPPRATLSTLSVLQDMAARNVDITTLSKSVLRRIVEVLTLQSPEQLSIALASLGASYEKAFRDACGDTGLPVEPPAPQNRQFTTLITADSSVNVDNHHSSFVGEFFPYNPRVTPLVAYARYESGLQNNLFPDPTTIGRLISALGRIGEIEKVRKMYHDAQRVLTSLEMEKRRQSQAWFHIEDQMIIACAHAGDLESAHVHRDRILAQGGAPTADSYGALIECVKDTTDDASNAWTLFQEARKHRVPPNIYLYNNVISKLAKARKADQALHLFNELKATQLQPSSITYGAVIAACARVGDAYSAEVLFAEMVQQRNYKPRIPPFNTMMQLYTQTKPNRDRVLYYYNTLLSTNIRPTAHTYKLLIDAYGSIEPVEVESMESVFRTLENDPHVEIQGNHWGAIINAWGCVKKDLDKSIAIFESISHHPSTLQSSTILPDAVTFEALINVFVAHRRTDLIPRYIERLDIMGIHMTAYIANCLIKGYAAVDNLEESRRIFESLQDPPEGIAASNNHVPHHPSSSSVPPTAPVYREPSTWETMVRAELGGGNRDRAVELLNRMQTRKFPAAVCKRIQGIMFDESHLPSASLEGTIQPSFA